MAVYTKINKKDISYINKKFESQKFLSFKGIKPVSYTHLRAHETP